MFSVASSTFQDYYGSKLTISNKLHLSHVCEEFVEKELLGLNPSKSTGLDNIPARFLRDGASILKSPHTHIINLSITSVIVPDDFNANKAFWFIQRNVWRAMSNMSKTADVFWHKCAPF